MIRGAVILAIGFSLGYAKALHDSDTIIEKLDDLKKAVINLSEEADSDNTVDGTATETAESSAVKDYIPNPSTEGETPS